MTYVPLLADTFLSRTRCYLLPTQHALFPDSRCLIRYQYDGAGSDGDDCRISTHNADLLCEISFDVPEDIPGPAYVYYELTNFYQNSKL